MHQRLRLLAALLLTAGCFAACSSPPTDEQSNAEEADAGDDADTGEPDADAPDDADGGDEDADTNGNDVCEPDCSGLQCGEDPECGESCGECDGVDVCDDGQCVEADTYMRWELDGEVVHESTSSEGRYYVSDEEAVVFLPHYGRTFEVWISDVPETNDIEIDCETSWDGISSGLSTSDNGWADLDDVPGTWKGLYWLSTTECPDGTDDEDEVAQWDLVVSSVKPDEAVGEFHVSIVGGGPREGSNLEVYGQFDIELEEQ